jgi:hypothetical protein
MEARKSIGDTKTDSGGKTVVVVELELIQIQDFYFYVYAPADAIRTRISFRVRQAFHYNCIVQDDQKKSLCT